MLGPNSFSNEATIHHMPCSQPPHTGCSNSHERTAHHDDGTLLQALNDVQNQFILDMDCPGIFERLLTTCAAIIAAYQNEERRREAESALTESEARFRDLADSFVKQLEGDVDVSGDKGTECRIRFRNFGRPGRRGPAVRRTEGAVDGELLP